LIIKLVFSLYGIGAYYKVTATRIDNSHLN